MLIIIYQKDVSCMKSILLFTNFTCFISHVLQELQSCNSLQSHRRLSWFYFRFELLTFSSNLHLHSHDSCWTKNLVSFFSDIKLNIFIFRFFNLFETHIQAYGSSIVLKTSTTLINTDSRLTIKRFIIVYINKGWSRLT